MIASLPAVRLARQRGGAPSGTGPTAAFAGGFSTNPKVEEFLTTVASQVGRPGLSGPERGRVMTPARQVLRDRRSQTLVFSAETRYFGQ